MSLDTAHLASLRWPADRAHAWRRHTGWLLGCNYTPRHAANQLELWQAPTWRPDLIAQELDWAAALGFNSLRLFLHHLAWQQDPPGFLHRLDHFLTLAHARGIGIIPVFFDSCWHPLPKPGPQRPPEPFVHNSAWLQSPGRHLLLTGTFPSLEPYVTAVLHHFKNDSRIHAWDLWNEPSNPSGHYAGRELPRAQKCALVEDALRLTLLWARRVAPAQPLTVGLWFNDFFGGTPPSLVELQIVASDIISFHSYERPSVLLDLISRVSTHQRPLLCTEYMARPIGSTFAAILPILHHHGIGAFNWGFVDGATQTKFPWDSWDIPYHTDPTPWFHEILHPDGTPYCPDEARLIRHLASHPPA